MIAILYTSRAVRPLNPTSLQQLVERAQERNAALQITGFLVYFGDRFMQYLEGEPNRMSVLIDDIRNDPRHDQFDLYDLGQIDSRYLSDWAMRDLSEADGILLEHVLRQNLLHWHSAGFSRDERRQQALRLVAKIAKVKELLEV